MQEKLEQNENIAQHVEANDRLKKRVLKLMFLHIRRKRRFLQAYSFQKYRVIMQKIKFYSFVTMKDKMAAQLSFGKK